ncbi:hypothetical protein, partial [Arthrobacter sp. BF1]|uniref:hypothetical protein n=1 Tax=Arthrobacter sp. BF1 TaxID=2821145 RepID=UPI001C4FC3A9
PTMTAYRRQQPWPTSPPKSSNNSSLPNPKETNQLSQILDTPHVPQSELLATMELLSAQGVEEWDIDRELLSVLGLKRMTQRTQDYLEECRSYSWKVN